MILSKGGVNKINTDYSNELWEEGAVVVGINSKIASHTLLH